MNIIFKTFLIVLSIGLFISTESLDESSSESIVFENDFLASTPQTEDQRRISGHLKSLATVNISDNHNLFRADLLTANQEYITIFDRGNFGFYQFDYDLRLNRTFGREGRGPGEFIHPIDLSVDLEGNYWIGDNRQNRISILSDSGELIEDLDLPFGTIPHRFALMDSENLALFSLSGSNMMTILNHDGEPESSFLSVRGLSFNQRGFIYDGRITSDDEIIYYTGTRNSMLKAYTQNGDLLYSRDIIDPLDLDLLNMSNRELRSSPFSVLDFAVYNENLLLLYPGPQDDENRWKYLDVYDKATGDYLETYLLENFSSKLSVVRDAAGDQLITLGYFEDTADLSLSVYPLTIDE